ncbi:hypothetical protein LTSEBAI_1149, partial [Salmonella enterica subsp. enterica serovar Baildon str. R6-199]
MRVLRCCREAEIIGDPPRAERQYRWRAPVAFPVGR